MVARGHDVVWAAPPDAVEHVGRAGLDAVAIGAARLTQPADALRRYPEVGSLPPNEVRAAMFGKLFGAMAAPVLLADLLPVAFDWRPDLVVADAAEFAGHIVAAELGVPSVTRGFGPLLPEDRMVAAAAEVAALWRSRGLEPRPYGGAYDHLYLDIYPPGLQSPAGAHVRRRQLLRPVTYEERAEGWAATPLPDGPSDAPLVYVTMGTVFARADLFDDLVRGVAGLDARVLVTTGPGGDPAALGPYGPRIRVERYVPQGLVLPHCDVVVSHGGSGTVLAALSQGVPQLCLPQGADQFLNADAVASAGAGISLTGPDVTAPRVRDAVARLLAEEPYAEAARRIGATLAAMPSPDDVAIVLESLH
jgi:UDP:flavonoid glycosyltransferase YjiC (YdhE family)